MSRVNHLEQLARELLNAIDTNTDCMSNQIDREQLDPYIDQAFIALADGGNQVAEAPILTFFTSGAIGQP